jgi:nucleotide-binding universal stress UspA family protein
MKRILHPTDFSSASRAAFATAVELAKANRGELTLVHVLAPPAPMLGEGYMSPKTYEDLVASAQAWARRQLDALVSKARKAGARARGLLVEGIAHEAIARAARSTRADLLVMGTHGRTGVAKFFLGSVAGRVLATAPCPVLTVRSPAKRGARGGAVVRVA